MSKHGLYECLRKRLLDVFICRIQVVTTVLQITVLVVTHVNTAVSS